MTSCFSLPAALNLAMLLPMREREGVFQQTGKRGRPRKIGTSDTEAADAVEADEEAEEA